MEGQESIPGPEKKLKTDASLSSQTGEKKRKQKINTESADPPVQTDPTRCHAFMERKRRFCKQRCNRGSRYCGNHLDLEEKDQEELTTSKDDQTQSKRKRIPCPIDPSHTIFEDTVDKHIEICPKTKQQRLLQQQPYYRHNVNTGGHGEMGKATVNKEIPAKRREETLEWAKRLAWRILYAHQAIFSKSLPASSNDNLRGKNNGRSIQKYLMSLTSQDIEAAIPLQDLSKKELDAGLAKSIEGYSIRTGGPKHLQQQASLVGHLRRIQLLPELPPTGDSETCRQMENGNDKTDTSAAQKIILLELGAGRGMMGLITAGIFGAAGIPNVNLFLVERCGTRSKAETVLRTHFHRANWKKSAENRRPECFDLDAVQGWKRIQADLSHVHMPTVLERPHHRQGEWQALGKEQKMSVADDIAPKQNKVSSPRRTNHMENAKDGSLEDAKIIALAKHLCGAGTDLALKALFPIRDQVSACIMATCCHGLCTWQDYVGRDYLHSEILTNASLVEEGMHEQVPLFEFGEAEFEMMRIWSSGSVKVDDNSSCKRCKTDGGESSEDDSGEAGHFIPTGTSDAAAKTREQVGVGIVVGALNLSCGVQGLGRACQRLIDHGRREWLRHVLFAQDGEGSSGMDAVSELCYYVPSTVTPQNAVLIANRK